MAQIKFNSAFLLRKMNVCSINIFVLCIACCLVGYWISGWFTVEQTCNSDLATDISLYNFNKYGSWLGLHSPPVNKKSIYLVILVLSAPGNLEQRNAIRQTWLSDENSDVIHYFVIGTKNLKEELNKSINSEESKFGDLLLLSEIQDSYQSLTKKVMSAFAYIHFHIDSKYVMKCDDDTFIVLPLLMEKVKNVPYKQRLYWGFFDGRATPRSTGVWKETKWLICDHYLPYALGGGYILSIDLVDFIAINSKQLKLFNNEDISVGSWLASVDLHRVHDTRFDTEYKSRGCNNAYLVSHKQSPGLMHEKFTSLKTNHVLCKEEFQVRLSYDYNWSVPPSKCCAREDKSVP